MKLKNKHFSPWQPILIDYRVKCFWNAILPKITEFEENHFIMPYPTIYYVSEFPLQERIHKKLNANSWKDCEKWGIFKNEITP